ncbi:hypothetical protein KPH14_000928 [Odynerus spinipes]|uniref:RNA-directed DNA polymerase n=1 Tax=Odynerus spinipes TaxID=1348599 RepID=A0AAD9REE2_9HYME|nr:hypothetical protein KPH14_000928 [Odynerus spinipes]
MKQRLRSKVWWDGIDKDAEKMVKSCRGCQLVRKTVEPAPLKRNSLPEGPWESLAMDLMRLLPSGENILVITDYYSRYFEIVILTTTTASVIKKHLFEIFARYGFPKSVVCDNGRQFTDAELKTWLETNNVKISHTALLWPQANGEVERQNRSILKRLRIAHAEGKDWKEELLKFLLMYRSTSHSVTGVSPAELLFKRKLRTKWPEIETSVFVEEEEAGSPKDLGPIQHPTNAYHASQPQWQIPSLLLPTAMVVLRSPTGRCCRIRALLDQGSEACFISERAAQMLRLTRKRVDAPIYGLGLTQTAHAKSFVHIEMSSSYNPDLKVEFTALILNKLTHKRPEISCETWPHIADLQLADPAYSSSTRLDLVIGVEQYGPLLLPEVRQGPPGSPTAQNTALGWILSGAVHTKARPSARTFCSHATTLGTFQDAETNELLRRFWEIEELPTTCILTSD